MSTWVCTQALRNEDGVTLFTPGKQYDEQDDRGEAVDIAICLISDTCWKQYLADKHVRSFFAELKISTPSELLQVRNSPIHGKGVFAIGDIRAGSEFTCDVLLIHSDNMTFDDYQYPWSQTKRSICIGFGAFFNHSETPNFRILNVDKINLTKTFVALHDIDANTELTTCYGEHTTFPE